MIKQPIASTHISLLIQIPSTTKRIIFILAGLIVLCQFERCPAAQTQKPIPIQEFKKVPAYAQRLMPRHSRTLRFGSSRIGSHGSPVFLRLYAQFLHPHIPSGVGSHLWPPPAKRYTVHIVLSILSRSTQHHSSQLHLLQSIRLEEQHEVAQSDIKNREFSLPEIMWLNARRHRSPVLIRESTLYIFSRGLSRKPYEQSFGDWGDLERNVSSAFDKVDARGLMTVTEIHSSHYGGTSTTSYVWDGTKFVVPSKVRHRPINPRRSHKSL